MNTIELSEEFKKCVKAAQDAHAYIIVDEEGIDDVEYLKKAKEYAQLHGVKLIDAIHNA